MGKILRIDLESKNFSTEIVDPELEEKYIGGAGVAAALFIKQVPPDIDPFDAQNLLIFSLGPICGTAIPYCGRHFVMAKSPLTRILGESSAGGFFGNELKKAGYDHIIFSRISKNPVYLWIHDDNIEIRDATELWGKGTRETEDLLKKEIGDDKVKVASIGPAGENLVKFASIMSEKGHAAGRCGMGAVMGSKKLKAIVVRGTKDVPIDNKDHLMDAVKRIQTIAKEAPLSVVMHDVGTLAHMDNYVSAGDVPIKNFTLSRWRGTKNIGFYALKESYEIQHYSCFNCWTACRGKIKYNNEWVVWPEYEFLAMMGSNLFIDDLEALIRWNIMVNDFGMDCISLGGVLGVFLETAERGLIDFDCNKLGFKKEPEKDQYKIWGDIPAIDNLIKLIAFRKEIGNDLADGVRLFCQNNNLPDDLNIQGKGLEIPAHEPRSNNMTALDLATSSRGAYHGYEPFHLSFATHLKKELGLTERIDAFSGGEEVVNAVKKIQDACESYTATGGCMFGFFYSSEISPWVDAVNAITGRSYTVDDWVKIGEKLFNLKRNYNIKCGITKKDDSIGTKFSNPIPKGGTKGNIPPLKDMLENYYTLRGWDSEGRPI
ncbi:MAG: aldehyde ferredoxin oxidoreductase family protein [Candidatus Lokiarchaeota archaeon]|nr:aldehyde ferredoxin oxidoreductase family protein [Candidatus Lokiarchaeota archaeon]